MSNKIKDIYIKNHKYYFFDDIINIKNLILIVLKEMKVIQKYCCYLLHWICDNQRFQRRKN